MGGSERTTRRSTDLVSILSFYRCTPDHFSELAVVQTASSKMTRGPANIAIDIFLYLGGWRGHSFRKLARLGKEEKDICAPSLSDLQERSNICITARNKLVQRKRLKHFHNLTAGAQQHKLLVAAITSSLVHSRKLQTDLRSLRICQTYVLALLSCASPTLHSHHIGSEHGNENSHGISIQYDLLHRSHQARDVRGVLRGHNCIPETFHHHCRNNHRDGLQILLGDRSILEDHATVLQQMNSRTHISLALLIYKLQRLNTLDNDFLFMFFMFFMFSCFSCFSKDHHHSIHTSLSIVIFSCWLIYRRRSTTFSRGRAPNSKRAHREDRAGMIFEM